MDDVRNQRLAKLRSRDRDTEKALVWLEGHQHLFQEPVFAPVLVLVSEGEGGWTLFGYHGLLVTGQYL